MLKYAYKENMAIKTPFLANFNLLALLFGYVSVLKLHIVRAAHTQQLFLRNRRKEFVSFFN